MRSRTAMGVCGSSSAVGAGLGALEVREVDALVSQLLDDVDLQFKSMGPRVLNQLADLKRVLAATYVQVPGMPSKELLRELAKVVQSGILTQGDVLNKYWDHPERFRLLTGGLGPRELEVRAEPYVTGAGLSLRGFFCRTDAGRRRKFVIFLNTAHHPGAVAATYGHELGHYVYGTICGETHTMTAFMEGTFGAHLEAPEELFADSLVALSAYSTELIREIGPLTRLVPGGTDNALQRIRHIYKLIGSRYKLDLSRSNLTAPWRVRYLTSMTHFFKLRCALYEHTGI